MSSIPHGVPQSNFSRRKITLRYAAAPEVVPGFLRLCLLTLRRPPDIQAPASIYLKASTDFFQ
jgi:hypothetical protein